MRRKFIIIISRSLISLLCVQTFFLSLSSISLSGGEKRRLLGNGFAVELLYRLASEGLIKKGAAENVSFSRADGQKYKSRN
jgi:hypothetical protein